MHDMKLFETSLLIEHYGSYFWRQLVFKLLQAIWTHYHIYHMHCTMLFYDFLQQLYLLFYYFFGDKKIAFQSFYILYLLITDFFSFASLTVWQSDQSQRKDTNYNTVRLLLMDDAGGSVFLFTWERLLGGGL